MSSLGEEASTGSFLKGFKRNLLSIHVLKTLEKNQHENELNFSVFWP